MFNKNCHCSIFIEQCNFMITRAAYSVISIMENMDKSSYRFKNLPSWILSLWRPLLGFGAEAPQEPRTIGVEEILPTEQS